MGANPVANVGKQNLPTFPRDQDNFRPAVLFGAIVDTVTKEIKGYLPLKVIDNGDGTATLKVKT